MSFSDCVFMKEARLGRYSLCELPFFSFTTNQWPPPPPSGICCSWTQTLLPICQSQSQESATSLDHYGLLCCSDPLAWSFSWSLALFLGTSWHLLLYSISPDHFSPQWSFSLLYLLIINPVVVNYSHIYSALSYTFFLVYILILLLTYKAIGLNSCFLLLHICYNA